jgi:hypothetical protein
MHLRFITFGEEMNKMVRWKHTQPGLTTDCADFPFLIRFIRAKNPLSAVCDAGN